MHTRNSTDRDVGQRLSGTRAAIHLSRARLEPAWHRSGKRDPALHAMRILNTRFEGVCLIELEPHVDERGTFMRTFCRRTFREHGLATELEQCNLVWSDRKATLRGLHYQMPPHQEDKVVHCLRGAIHDVILDLRPDSPTYGESISHQLTAARPAMIHVPKGCAHGYQTLEPGTGVCYFMSAAYAPDAERGVRFDDPAFELDWPLPDPVVSARDRAFPDFEPPA